MLRFVLSFGRREQSYWSSQISLAAPPAARLHDTTAGLLALGSSPLATFPVSQWYPGHRLFDYNFGGQPRIGGKEPFTAFPFDPREGHRRRSDTGGGEAPSTGFGRPLPRLDGPVLLSGA